MFDVLGIGNPLLDFTVEVDDETLNDLKLEKAKMHLLDQEHSDYILRKLNNKEIKVSAGGSSANTVAGIGVLGGTGAYIGSVGDDQHGKLFERLSQDFGIQPKLVKNKLPTGHSIIFITPDGERTMATYLGACLELTKDQIDESLIKKCEILHIEGFQFENSGQTEASIYAMRIAAENGIKISIDLADSLFIERHTELVKDIVQKYADIIFVNEREAEAFTGEEDPEEALKKIHDVCETAIVTLGVRGSLIMNEGNIYKIPSSKVSVVNTNGAGDMYDAGILYGIVNKIDLERAGKIASYAAAQVVNNMAARLERSLKNDISKL